MQNIQDLYWLWDTSTADPVESNNIHGEVEAETAYAIVSDNETEMKACRKPTLCDALEKVISDVSSCSLAYMEKLCCLFSESYCFNNLLNIASTGKVYLSPDSLQKLTALKSSDHFLHTASRCGIETGMNYLKNGFFSTLISLIYCVYPCSPSFLRPYSLWASMPGLGSEHTLFPKA